MKKTKLMKYKFKLFPAVRYIGKMEATKTLFKITIATDLLKDESLFVSTLIHEMIHADYYQMFLSKTLTQKECDFCDWALDRFECGEYCCITLDDFHWNEDRIKKRMIL